MPVSGGAIVDARKIQAQKDADNQRIRQLKSDWNDYVDWVGKKGLKYSRALDKGEGDQNEGNKLLAQYIKENPKTTLRATKEGVGEIQTLLKDIFSDIQSAGKTGILTGEDLLKVSDVDYKAGSITSSRKFPKSTVRDTETGEVYEGGFIVPGNYFPDLPPEQMAKMQAAMKLGRLKKADTSIPAPKLSVPKKDKKLPQQPQPSMPIPPSAAIRQPMVQKAVEDLGENVYGPGGSLIGFIKGRKFVEASGDYIKGIKKSDLDLLQGDTNQLNEYLKSATQGVAEPYVRPMPK